MKQRKTICYVISEVQHAVAFEWTAQALSANHDFLMVVLNERPGALERNLRAKGISVISLTLQSKWELLAVVWRLYWLFRRTRPDVVHGHLFAGSLAGLAAAWLARVPKRMYTRHTSTYHHDFKPSGIKYDRLCNFLATQIVSISQATDYALAQLEQVSAAKIVRIPHGFQFDYYAEPARPRVEAIRKKWGLESGAPTVGVVARHILWKGIQFIIPAFDTLRKQYPEAKLVLANAMGPDHTEIMKLASAIPPDNLVVIPFEEDMAALYRTFDLYVHVPIDTYCEAFGQTYVEALACGLPSVFSASGIAAEFVKHEEHALIVPFKNSQPIAVALVKLWENPALRDRLGRAGKEYVTKHFGFQSMVQKLEAVYHG